MGCLTKFVSEGLGKHINCLDVGQIPQLEKWSIISQICNVIGIGLAKISLCLYVLKIIGDRIRRNLRVFLWAVIAFSSASHLAQVILFLVQCRPMAAIWDPQIHGKCFSSHITYLAGYIGFGLDAFTDLVCAAIPISVFYQSQIKKRNKIALSCLMGIGSLTAGCAIAKAVTLKGVFAQDYSWALTAPAMCTIIEHLVGMSLICAPTLAPLIGRAFDLATSRASSKRSTKRTSGYTTPTRYRDASYYARNNKYLKDNESRLTQFPLHEGSIVKTTSFRMGSERTSLSGLHSDDSWPLPPSSRHTGGAGRFEKTTV